MKRSPRPPGEVPASDWYGRLLWNVFRVVRDANGKELSPSEVRQALRDAGEKSEPESEVLRALNQLSGPSYGCVLLHLKVEMGRESRTYSIAPTSLAADRS